ncbi:hypothetical protein C0992_004943 [Termitomyces sp. T32_za158]|nr:hypothetical protein C0992_004943 [Termitomyces sp. T32_za158]
MFDVEGLPTGAGSQADALMHSEPLTTTAPSVQRRLALGASLTMFNVDHAYLLNLRALGTSLRLVGLRQHMCSNSVGERYEGKREEARSVCKAYGMRSTHGSLSAPAGGRRGHCRLICEEAVCYAGYPMVLTLLRPKETPKPFDSSKRSSTQRNTSRLEPHSSSPLRQLCRRLLETPETPQNHHRPARIEHSRREYRSWVSVDKPLVDAYKDKFNTTLDVRPARGATHASNNFLDAQSVFHTYRESAVWELLQPDINSCSDALFMYDATTGGRPSYRVEEFKLEYKVVAPNRGPFLYESM